MSCECVGCFKQLGTCPGCKALYSVVDVSDPIADLIPRAGFDGRRSNVLSPLVTNTTVQLFKRKPASALVSFVGSGDKAELEHIRPAHRLVHVSPDGQATGSTNDVVPAKTGQPSVTTIDDDDPSSSCTTVTRRRSKTERKLRQIILP